MTTTATGLRKAGRPRKEPQPPANVSDASLDLLVRYAAAIVQIMQEKRFVDKFTLLGAIQKQCLSNDLAYELAFFPALDGVLAGNSTGRTGPRAKAAQGFFLTQIRQVLGRYGVALSSWQKADKKCTDLVDFCTAMQKVAGIHPGTISMRTVAAAPTTGFQG